MAEENIRDQVAKKLEENSGISGADIAALASSNDVEETGEELEESVALEEDSKDPMLERAEHDQPFQKMGKAMTTVEKDGLRPQSLGLMSMTEVEVTEDDKYAFLDCLVDGGRFTRKFSIFAGRTTGKFRSRSTEETTAILNEISRKARRSPHMNDVEYSALLRHCVMAFQIAELNGVEYPEMDGPLKAVYDIDTDGATEPKWWKLVDKYDKMPEGLEHALYTELMDFERVYWTLVQKAQDQNFWNPGDSTSE